MFAVVCWIHSDLCQHWPPGPIVVCKRQPQRFCQLRLAQALCFAPNHGYPPPDAPSRLLPFFPFLASVWQIIFCWETLTTRPRAECMLPMVRPRGRRGRNVRTRVHLESATFRFDFSARASHLWENSLPGGLLRLALGPRLARGASEI